MSVYYERLWLWCKKSAVWRTLGRRYLMSACKAIKREQRWWLRQAGSDTTEAGLEPGSPADRMISAPPGPLQNELANMSALPQLVHLAERLSEHSVWVSRLPVNQNRVRWSPYTVYKKYEQSCLYYKYHILLDKMKLIVQNVPFCFLCFKICDYSQKTENAFCHAFCLVTYG